MVDECEQQIEKDNSSSIIDRTAHLFKLIRHELKSAIKSTEELLDQLEMVYPHQTKEYLFQRTEEILQNSKLRIEEAFH
jgi:hypothetical protein